MGKKTIEVEESKDESALRKTSLAVRCAKAMNLVSSLKNRLVDSSVKLMLQEEEEKLRTEIENLRMKLVMEKMKIRKIKLCGFTEFLLMVMICIGFWFLIFLLITFAFS